MKYVGPNRTRFGSEILGVNIRKYRRSLAGSEDRRRFRSQRRRVVHSWSDLEKRSGTSYNSHELDGNSKLRSGSPGSSATCLEGPTGRATSIGPSNATSSAREGENSPLRGLKISGIGEAQARRRRMQPIRCRSLEKISCTRYICTTVYGNLLRALLQVQR